MQETRAMPLRRWQVVTLIALQLLYATCAASVLVYNAMGWAPEVIDFGWLSYRAFNIYISLALIGYLGWGLARRRAYILPVLAAFSLFHLIEGILIAFWSKAVIQLAALAVLARIAYARRTATCLIKAHDIPVMPREEPGLDGRP